MRQLITKLSRSAPLRRLVIGLRLHRAGNWYLRHFPQTRRLPGSGVVYRARRLESIPLASEMFEQGKLYEVGVLPSEFTYFADLGCNVGYFTCWLGHLAKGRPLKGLMVDANPEAVAEAQWHAHANGWNQVYALQGIVGEKGEGGARDFYLYDSNICSTTELPDVKAMGLKGRWTRITVPCLSVEENWRQRFQEAPCHVLKIDIEGSELNFVQAETSFLRRVESILLEWHKWRVGLAQVQQLLSAQGFTLKKILEENDTMGTAFFGREKATRPSP